MFSYRSILHEQARPAAIRESRRAPWLAVSVVCFGAFMGQLDASIVTITFPAMERDFSVQVAAVQWVSLIYLLGLVAMLAPAGRLGDAVGRKLVYTYGFAVFTVASAACGLAPSLGTLVALRLIQAIGAAMLQANSVALVTTSAPKARMRFALGIQAGAQSVGLALGPTLGGLLTTMVGWRAVYWVNVPVGIVAVVAGRYLLPRTRQFSRLGFGLAALFGDLVLPRVWGDRRRGFAGALLACAVMCAAIVVPVTQATVVPLLALAGLGLGIFVPANNTVIMRSTADSSASLVGGLVSMARGIGTTFGISLMALALHLGTQSSQVGNHGYAAHHGYPGAEQARPAFIVLAVVAATAAAIALAGRRRARGQPAGGLARGPGVPGRRTRQVQIAENAAQEQVGPDQIGGEQIGPELAGIVSRLRRAMRRAARAADPALELSVAQLELLSCITEHPGIRPSQLARMLRLAPSSVATLLGGLQSSGYVTRTPGGSCRRRHRRRPAHRQPGPVGGRRDGGEEVAPGERGHHPGGAGRAAVP